MNNIAVKFIGKEYSIPKDVITYIDLLDFADNVQKQLMADFISIWAMVYMMQSFGMITVDEIHDEQGNIHEVLKVLF